MARPRMEMDLKRQILKRYDELLKEKAELDDELKGLSAFLKATGAVRGKRRGRSKKAEQASPAVPAKKIQKTKPKAKRRGRPKKTEQSAPVAAEKAQKAKPVAKREKAATKKRTRPAKVEKPTAAEQSQV